MRRLLTLGCVLAVAGCGPRTGDVSGQVRFDGQLLPSGRVTFVCEGGNKPVLTSDIRDGAYKIANAPVGRCKVAVATFQTTTAPVPNMPAGAASPPGGATAPAGKYVAIPAHYHDPERSGLVCTVQGGSQPHEIDLSP
jgi:hypothetical protein